MDFSAPFFLSSHQSQDPPFGEGWLLASGDGFIVATGYYFTGFGHRVESVVSEVDTDGAINQGPSELYSPGGSYTRMMSCFGAPSSSLLVTAINVSTFDLLVSGLSGTGIATRFTHNITDPEFSLWLNYGDDLVYVPSIDRWLLLSYVSGGDLKLLPLTITSSSVTELGMSTGVLYPSTSEPEFVFAEPVGTGGDVVYFSNIYLTNQFIFSRVKVGSLGNVAIDYGFTLPPPDSNGVPIGLAGNLNGDGFVALYSVGTEIKAVYGELSGANNLVIGNPVTLASGTVYDRGHVCWQQGIDSVVAVINYYDNDESVDMVTVVRLQATPSTLQIEAIWSDSYSFEALLSETVSSSFDESTNRVMIGLIGDGGATLAESGKMYVLSAEGGVPVSFFWHNHTLQDEAGNGKLDKLPTVKILPGKAGQPYIPPRAAIEPSVAIEVKVNYVCERVI